jgi:hypothetical protein
MVINYKFTYPFDITGLKVLGKYAVQNIFGLYLVILTVPLRQLWPNLKGLLYILKLNLIQATFVPPG